MSDDAWGANVCVPIGSGIGSRNVSGNGFRV